MKALDASRGNAALLRRYLSGAALHAVAAWGGLSLSYCAYKAYVRALTGTFPLGLKWEIKSAFPSAIMIFAAVYVIRRALFSGAAKTSDYALMLAAYLCLVNTLALSYSKEALLVFNLSAPFIAMLLGMLFFLKRLEKHIISLADRYGAGAEARRLASMARGLVAEAVSMVNGLPSGLLAAGTLFFMLAAILMIAKQPATAEVAASAAYFLMLSGVLLKLARSVKGGAQEGD
ncbi:MAG TPA: hypothetical protein DDW94_12230 [Deltaproteobacteria bacterium]|nr:MAG: hypothetical protein A2Z79_08375 [Deltaproteobacteria bacterium GWA2_55_82]OGQ63136.1 MAG: hypothetical protein A3I81_10005 [Deltaproteobacteria bacterium RIFCSPLOWO2_02_FULL_55_12]OIJ73601.1 MAG: hypothetical protein A2V21_304570 [Deltaproteobacteria bacterium GWC2_55_46]HBG47736.1 hypothetical protein [Deltaproteobacteria bacterium]HCY12042.1 hypothetical protein [Deltaproteobacteria bacterium]